MRFARGCLVLAALGCSSPPPDDARPGTFAVVVLPDTQHYSDRYPHVFDAQTRWIVEHAGRERIAFVTHVGDVVQSGAKDPNEWEVAERALGRLDGVVPWGIAIGNHDYDRVNDRDGAPAEFVRRFGPTRFQGQPGYGGHSPNGLNSFHFFQANGRRYLILHLEADVPDEAIRWADSVLRDHPGSPVIVTTHIYLDDETRRRTTKAYFRGAGNSGEQIWQKFIRRQPRIFLVLCGHFGGEGGEWCQSSTNDAGGRVIELLSDYQEFSNGGNGWLRVLRFDPERGQIRVRTYSPWLDRYERDRDSEFVLPWKPPA